MPGARSRARLVAGLLLGALLAVLAPSSVHAEDPPWSPPGYLLDHDGEFAIPEEDRCDVGHQWGWTGRARTSA